MLTSLTQGEIHFHVICNIFYPLNANLILPHLPLKAPSRNLRYLVIFFFFILSATPLSVETSCSVKVKVEELTASRADSVFKLFFFSASCSLFASDCQTSLSLLFLPFLLLVNSCSHHFSRICRPGFLHFCFNNFISEKDVFVLSFQTRVKSPLSKLQQC